MAIEQFPGSDLDREDAIVQPVAGFWLDVYRGGKLVRDYLTSLGHNYRRAYGALELAHQTLSRFTVPIYRTEPWTFWTFSAETQGSLAGGAEYGQEGLLYGGGAIYGDRGALARQYPLPARLAQAPLACNRITSPSLVLVENVDYLIDDGVLSFRQDPFTSDDLPRREYLSEADDVVVEGGLWLCQPAYDDELIYKHHGYVVGLQLPSSPAYRDALNAIVDADVQGPAQQRLEEFLTASLGIPISRHTQETVELVTVDAHGLLIVTDQEVYRAVAHATPTVAAGDVITEGAVLIEGLILHPFSDPDVPDVVQAIACGRQTVSAAIKGDLVFLNQDMPTTVTTAEDGHTVLQFPVGGFAADVDAFWEEVDSRGVAAGQTLANLLDLRETPVGEPGPASLPTTINPMLFVTQNLLSGHGLLLRIDTDIVDPAALGLSLLRWLPKLVEKTTLLVVSLSTATEVETAILEGVSGPLSTTQDAGLLDVLPDVAETMDLPDIVTESYRWQRSAAAC